MSETPLIVFYDGECGVCHRFVRFLVRRDRAGHGFRFAPLGGETFLESIPEVERSGLPDSVVVRLPDGALLVRSRGALACLERLGRGWRLLARGARVVPRALRDGLYDAFARRRYRLAARPETACPIVPEALRGRFLP